MPLFTSPRSVRLAMARAAADYDPTALFAMDPSVAMTVMDGSVDALKHKAKQAHPDFGHLCLLVFEAVMEVVCVSAPGYVFARQGMLNAEMQKFLANLNVNLFTPCLVFIKIASQLNADKLAELAVIPVIFVVLTLVSFLSGILVSWLFGFKKRPRNFVLAMAVFANSNSLPISLVLSLSKTLSGLHWDKIPGDNDDEVGARGILYLLIFQQLGQIVRWSWGYNVLLAPKHTYEVEGEGDRRNDRLERGEYLTNAANHSQRSLLNDSERSSLLSNFERERPQDSDYESATPVSARDNDGSSSCSSSSTSSSDSETDPETVSTYTATPANGNLGQGPSGSLLANKLSRHESSGRITSFPPPPQSSPSDESLPAGWKGLWPRLKRAVTRALGRFLAALGSRISAGGRAIFNAFPTPVQKVLTKVWLRISRFFRGLMDFMNPPLWSLIIGIVVACVPALQHTFFTPGTFINNSVTRAVNQSGNCAVPLILVVLGGNLARNTLPKEDDADDADDAKVERKLLVASLVSRMLLPTAMMAPLLALTAKFVPVSILDDPIFVVVCFLLTGAPSALQLAQICQLNNVYMGAMSKLLFQSYVVWYVARSFVPLFFWGGVFFCLSAVCSEN
ncbi:auxin efflux carrier [Lineolata rhizophorae]|uniref:Auxin efflux carrier n=1 Tax=Lineolata rhizophorae TaxID=578093 RepID=A0A6A6PDC8_9PEZI|nr:auxin efflux carrier [Lineolata rhizophorae]